MLKCIIFMKSWIPVSSTGMTRRGHLDDRRGATWMTEGGYLDDKKRVLGWQRGGARIQQFFYNRLHFFNQA
ncbi:MAG: hypothetical protein ACR5K9_06455 [Wolbachia sp.]